MKTKLSAILILAMSALAGCGGSSSSSTSSAPVPLAPVTITANNTTTVSKAALSAATQDVGGSAISTVGVQTSTVSTDDRILYRLTDLALQKLAEQQSAPAIVTGATISVSCANGGTVALSSDAAGATPATYITLTFSNCITGSETATGSLSLSAISRPSATALQGTVSIDLTVARTNLPTLKLIGGYTLSATGITTATRTNTLAGTSLVFTKGTLNEALTNFSFATAFNTSGTPVIHTDTVGYTVSSDFTGGSFTFTTITAFVKNSTETYPHSGVAVISGAGASTLRVTVLGSDPVALNQVQIEFSADGVTYGLPTLTTWSAIKN